MPSEPEWLASISSSSVCTWFYILAITNSILAIAGVLTVIMILTGSGKTTFMSILPLILSIAIGFTNAWFMFVVCNRGINKEGFRLKASLTKSALGLATAGKYGM